MLKQIILVWLLSISFLASLHSQDTLISKKQEYLKVYLDGVGDWENYIKVKLWYADYVRDPQLSQVQVLISNQATASGGLKYSIRFIGKNNFLGKNDTIQLTVPMENSNRETRDELTNSIAMGLMPYMANLGQQKYVTLSYENKDKIIMQSIDRWKNWVFTTSLNTNLSANQSSEVFEGDGSLSAARITNQWKNRLTASLSMSNNNYETSNYSYSGNTIIKNFKALTVGSINEHWSWGVEPVFYASTFSNIKYQYSLATGVEYNLFPYSESINRLFTLKYRVQPLYNYYIDSTVFLKTKQFLFNHILDVTYTKIASWGNVSTTLTASNFLNHTKAYRFDIVNQMNFRIAKGLFFNITANASLINNQLSISKKNLLPEQILLQQRETLTNYSYGIQIGIRYTFGSIYNNIVNPRYEGGVTIDPEVINVETPD